MKTLFTGLIAAIIVGLLVVDRSPAGEGNVALAVKVVQDVTRTKDDIDWTKAKKGDVLYSGDQVRTGDRSIAIVKFLDNSLLRVREKSQLKLFGEQKEGLFSKTVHVERGQFSFDVRKQENEQFTFTSPTSVASIRGTQGTMQTAERQDVVTVVEGLVNLLNSSSKDAVNVGEGQTGISRGDGSVEVREASPEELDRAQSDIRAGRGSGIENQLEIELQDQQGNKKQIKIRYRD